MGIASFFAVGDLITCEWTDDVGVVADVSMYHSRFSYLIVWADGSNNDWVDEDDVRLCENR